MLYQLDYADVQERFEERDIRRGEPFWLAVRGNLERFSDAEGWWKVVSEDIKPGADDTEFLAAAAEEPREEGTWKIWTDAVKARTGAEGRGSLNRCG